MTKLFTSGQIRKIDAYTIEHEPVSSIDLMERAAGKLADWLMKNYSRNNNFKVFVGPGNNGGDGWALTRILWKNEYRNLEIFLLNTSQKLSVDSGINRERLGEETNLRARVMNSESDFPVIQNDDIVIDALFGTGLSRPLEGIAARLVAHLNGSSAKNVVAIDIPSGLFCEDNTGNIHGNIIKATDTLTFQFPKLAFFFPENAEYLGRWHVLNIGLHPEIVTTEPTSFHYITLDDTVERLRLRRKFSHKGTYGHALVIAGSAGMMGAAVLTSKAAARAGAGLVTVHVPRSGIDIMHSSVPEVLVSADDSDTHFCKHPSLENFSAIAIGPGIGKNPVTKQGISDLLQETDVPVVIDADGLNLLSTLDEWVRKLPAQAVLTPHPREFERLFGLYNDNYSRLLAQMKFSEQNKCVIILKGAHTCITTTDGNAWFNTTGNPGMAKGGSGDALTGIITGLLAQGYSIDDASVMAVYIHGYAGDLASEQMGQYGMLPSDLIEYLGKVFSTIEKKKAIL